MLLRFLFSTVKNMSSKGTIFNYEYETSRACTRYHRRSLNSLWAKLLTTNWKLQSLTRSLCYIFLTPPSRIAKVLISGWECKAAYESIWFFFFRNAIFILSQAPANTGVAISLYPCVRSLIYCGVGVIVLVFFSWPLPETSATETSLKKANSRRLNIYRSYSTSFNLSNVDEFLWSWILKLSI